MTVTLEYWKTIVDEICDMYKLPKDLPIGVGTSSKRYYGFYWHKPARIELMRDFIMLNEKDVVFQTVYHEAMHHINRMVFSGKHHDKSFKRLMSLLEFKPRTVKYDYTYKVSCTGCGAVWNRFRLRNGIKSYTDTHWCGRCKGELTVERLK